MNERDPCCITVSAVIVWFDLHFVVLSGLFNGKLSSVLSFTPFRGSCCVRVKSSKSSL